MNDPIFELLNDLECYKKPSLAWVMKWSEGGREPLNTAWENCRNPVRMLEFLSLYDYKFYIKAYKIYERYRSTYHWKVNTETFEKDNEIVCDALRRFIPVVITLAELLANA